MKLKEAIKKAEESIEETLACCDFPSEHWARIHINNLSDKTARPGAVKPQALLFYIAHRYQSARASSP